MDLRPVKRLPRAVTLAEIRATAALMDIALVRMPRLSVVPADAAQWKALLGMAGR